MAVTMILKDDEWRREIRRLIGVGRNYKEPLDTFGAYMVGSVNENFRAQGRPEKWPDVKDETKFARFLRGNRGRKRKRRLGTPAASRFLAGFKILIDRGRLKNSIGWSSKRNVVEIGTNVIYAATHNFGDDSRNIKERRFLLFQRSDINYFHELIHRWISEGKV